MGNLSMRTTAGLKKAAMLALMLVLVGGCGGKKSTEEDRGVLITPAGGTVSDPGGVTLHFPPGAVSQNVYIKVKTYYDNASLPATPGPALAFDCAADLQPHGLEFQAPVTIIFPAGRSLTPDARFPIFYYNEAEDYWMQSDSLATVAADGHSFAAQITHFSIWGGDGNLDEGGLFDNLEENLAGGNPAAALADFISWFRDRFGDIGEKGVYRNECQEIAGMAFDLGYVIGGDNGSLYEQIGQTTDHTLIASYQYDRGDLNGSFYFDIQITVYLRCTAPDIVVAADPANIASGESSDITATMTCGGTPMHGKRITFGVSGPGNVRPTSATTTAQGEAQTEYLADEDGIATITASHQACADGQPVTASGQTQVNIGGWTATLTAIFSHHNDDPYWNFADIVTIEFSFSIADDSIRGTGGGSHNAALTVEPPCAIVSAQAADFPTNIGGTAGGGYANIIFSSYNALEYPVVFMMQCPDFGLVPVPEYGPLVSYVIAMDIRPHILLQDGAQASGSGSENFGETWPMYYSYTLTLHH